MDFSEHLRNFGETDRIKTIFDEGAFKMKKIHLKDVNEFEYDDGWETEKVLAVFNGHCRVHLLSSNERLELEERDVCYLSLGERIRVTKLAGEPLIMIAEGRTDFKTNSYVKKFKQVKGELRGDVGFRRVVYTIIGEDDPAGKLILGFTEGFNGEWTSFPPHKHDDMIEAYLFYGLKGFYAIQLVENNDNVVAYIVRDFDVVLIRKGYHPNAGLPKSGINYLWVIYPLKERKLKLDFHPSYL